MKSDQDLVRRLHAAAETVPVEPPELTGAIAAGRRRGIRRGVGTALVAAVIGTATVWAVAQLGVLHGNERHPVVGSTFDPSDAHRIDAPYGGAVLVPDGWFDREGVIPDNADLVLSTTRSALDAAIQLCGRPEPDACGSGDITAQDVGRADAFVQVWVFYGYCECTPSPLPEDLSASDFRPAGSIDGQPVMKVQNWVDDGTQVQARYWVGPDASEATREATEFLVANLNLPGPRFEPTDTHPVAVPYSSAPIPVPNGWASATAESEHVTLGLAASTNANAVRNLVDGCTPSAGSCSIRPIRQRQLRPDDAFVEVQISYCCPPHGDPLPPRIRSEDFPSVGQLLGADLYVLSGVAVDRGLYTITFWEGPDATSATQEALLFLVEALNLPHAAPPPPGQEFQDPDHHFTIEIPDGWVRAQAPLTPRSPSLAEIFSAGSYPLRPGGGSCDQFPVEAVDDLGPEDSFVWIAEVSPGGGFPPRPDTFAGHDATQHIGEQFCLPTSARAFRQWIFPFAQGDRSFYLYVGVGEHITAARRAEAWRLADSFDPEPAESPASSESTSGTSSSNAE